MRLIGYIVAVLLGLPASLVAGAAVFADGPSILSSERVIPVVGVYLVAAGLFGFAFRLIWRISNWWRYGISISTPAFFAVGLLGTDIGLGYQLLYVVMIVASASAGALGGTFFAAALRPVGGDAGWHRWFRGG
jgi:hypothetical protein